MQLKGRLISMMQSKLVPNFELVSSFCRYRGKEKKERKPLTKLRPTLTDLVGNHPKLVCVGFGLANQ
jgi:hypothetical protein